MQSTSELEAQAKSIFAKHADQRKEGKYNPMTFVSVAPNEVNWAEMNQSPYKTAIDCSECQQSLAICAHNPYLNGEIPRSARIAPRVEDVETPEDMETTDEIDIDIVENFTVKAKRRYPLVAKFTEEQHQEFIDAYLEGLSTLAVATKFDAPMQYVYNVIKTAGIMRPKGIQKGANRVGISLGKPRDTVILTPELIEEVMKRYNNGNGETLQFICSDLNLAPSEVSPALKERGVVIRRGKRKAQ